VFCTVVFFFPEMGGYFLEKPNFEISNPLKTPDHIAPVWYFTPFYAILRAVPSIAGSALPGVLAMGAAIAVLFVLPWLGRSPVKPNFAISNHLTPPDPFAPVWYFTPFCATLRGVPSIAGSALPGVLAMGAAIAVLFVLPWLDRSPVKSIRYKGWMSKLRLVLFCVSFVILGVLGAIPATPGRT